MTAWAAKHGITPDAQPLTKGSTSTDGGAGSSNPADDLYASKCLGDAATAKARQTAHLLVELEALMADYRLIQNGIPDAPGRCVTKLGGINDPQAPRVQALIDKDHDDQVTDTIRKYTEEKQRFDEVDLPLAWTWVAAIVPGAEFAILPGVKVTSETTLMLRMKTRKDLDVETEQACIVAEDAIAGGEVALSCRGPRAADGSLFYVTVERSSGAPGGPLANVGIGDLVSFKGHLLLTRRPRDRERIVRWSFQQVPASGVKIVAPSTCCHAK